MDRLTYRSKATKCPSCGKKVDAHTAIQGKKAVPKVGDISICLNCAVASTYNENLDLQLLCEQEIKEMQTKHPQEYVMLRRAQAIIMKIKAEKN